MQARVSLKNVIITHTDVAMTAARRRDNNILA